MPILSIILFLFLNNKVPDYYTQIGEDGKVYMFVFVWGEVINPGMVKVPYKSDLLFVISQAGGIKNTADLNKVWIKHYKNKKREKISLKDFIDGKNERIPTLNPGDIVYVEMTKWAKLKRKLEPIYFISTIAGTALSIINLYLTLSK